MLNLILATCRQESACLWHSHLCAVKIDPCCFSCARKPWWQASAGGLAFFLPSPCHCNCHYTRTRSTSALPQPFHTNDGVDFECPQIILCPPPPWISRQGARTSDQLQVYWQISHPAVRPSIRSDGCVPAGLVLKKLTASQPPCTLLARWRGGTEGLEVHQRHATVSLVCRGHDAKDGDHRKPQEHWKWKHIHSKSPWAMFSA